MKTDYCFYCGAEYQWDSATTPSTLFSYKVCQGCVKLWQSSGSHASFYRKARTGVPAIPIQSNKGGVIRAVAQCMMCGNTARPGKLYCDVCYHMLTSAKGMYGGTPQMWTTSTTTTSNPNPTEPNCTCYAGVGGGDHTPSCKCYKKKELPLEQQYVGGLRLIRGWNLSDSSYSMNQLEGECGLYSLAAPGFQWTADILRSHQVPSKGGGNAGFFGFYDWEYALPELWQQPILGTYIGWGRTVVGSKGMRTEYAKLEYLCLNPQRSYDSKHILIINDLAAKLCVPLKQYKDLLGFKTGMVPLDEERILKWNDEQREKK